LTAPRPLFPSSPPPHPPTPPSPPALSPEFHCAVRLLALVRDRAPGTFKAWVNQVCASVGRPPSGGDRAERQPSAGGGGSGSGSDGAPSGGSVGEALYLLNRVEEAAVVDWPGWGQPPAGKVPAYLKVRGPEAGARPLWGPAAAAAARLPGRAAPPRRRRRRPRPPAEHPL
jgi:hypothetical protein